MGAWVGREGQHAPAAHCGLRDAGGGLRAFLFIITILRTTIYNLEQVLWGMFADARTIKKKKATITLRLLVCTP